MKTRPTLLASLALARGEALAPIDDVEWGPFRQHVGELLAGLKKLDAELPAETTRAVQTLIDQKAPKAPGEAARAVQKLLDAHCLVGVHINPESRVHADRGERAARLVKDRATHVLVRVHNEGGVTHPLGVLSEQAVQKGGRTADRWVEVSVLNEKPFARQLTGQRVEYRVLKLVPRQAGKREATLAFDVGQGTQDLGFRSEVPILFTVR